MKGVKFSENLRTINEEVFRESGLRSVEFPASLRTISQAAFCKCQNLRTVKFGEGLEVLGADVRTEDGKLYYGVFQESGLECIQFP